MEFKYNLNEIFKKNISKIDYTLLPSDFYGDRKSAQIYAAQVASIIDAMGYASAKAQDLSSPITSADKMRNFDHTLYLMIEPDSNGGKGSLVGLLKIGMKNLFVFDVTGMVHEKKSLCILDFYVHESKQRTGFGKKLYDYMLHDKAVEPNKLAIDKPSEKFLSFLYKHYGLAKIYPQSNNFVLFEGFFGDEKDGNESVVSVNESITPVNAGIGEHNSFDNHSVKSDQYKPTLYGRHTAFKPHDSMGKCLEWISPPRVGRHIHTNQHTALW